MGPPTANMDPKKTKRQNTQNDDVQNGDLHRGFGGSKKIAKKKSCGQKYLQKKRTHAKINGFPGPTGR